MSTLEELGILDDQTQIEIPDEIPEEGGGYVPLIQPGKYVFKLPSDLGSVWSKFESQKGTRISAYFGKENPLKVVEDDVKYKGMFKDSPAQTFINNLEYRRGREGVEVADMTYLIQALEANLPDDEKSKFITNASFVKALQKYEGKLFKATVSWTAYCNPNKNIWAFIEPESDEEQGRTEEIEGTPGCQRNYTSYARNTIERIPNRLDLFLYQNPELTAEDTDMSEADQQLFLERFDEFMVHGDPDECPARLRCNIRLTRFEPFVKSA